MNKFSNRVLRCIIYLYDFWYTISVFSSFKVIVCYQVRRFVRRRNVEPDNSLVISADASLNTEPVGLNL